MQKQKVSRNKSGIIPNLLHNTHISDIEIYNADGVNLSGLGETTEQREVTNGTNVNTNLQQFFEKARAAKESTIMI